MWGYIWGLSIFSTDREISFTHVKGAIYGVFNKNVFIFPQVFHSDIEKYPKNSDSFVQVTKIIHRIFTDFAQPIIDNLSLPTIF